MHNYQISGLENWVVRMLNPGNNSCSFYNLLGDQIYVILHSIQKTSITIQIKSYLFS